ncbi:VanW family protein [Paenibacillus amylolyticus]|uniref:VanW family protein n=1 Tax=Paenibacillus amylolyticus TaxID=1451 RepID=UPI003EBA2503
MKKIHVTVIVLFSLLLISSASYGLLYVYVNQPNFPKGVQVGGWALDDKPRKQVLAELQTRIQQLQDWPVTIEVAEPNPITMTHPATELGVSYHVNSFKAAVKQLDEGNLWERAYARYRFPQTFPLDMAYNEQTFQQLLSPAWEKETFGIPAEAVRRITANDQVQYIPEKSVRRIDWKTLSALVQNKLHRDLIEVNDGVKPDPIRILLPLYTLKPEVTIDSLKQEGIERKIVQFSTGLGNSSQGRVHNVSAAAQAIHGMILLPGGVFDYEKVIRKAEKDYGFREAPVIVNGRLTPGIGGGICQVSSTVYNAALLTGLDIVERRNHSMPVKYLPKGLDATFASGAINFRFRNSTEKSLLIHAKVQGGRMVVKFFGTFPENVSYALESHTIETLSVPVKYVSSNVLPEGAQQVLQNGQPGYIVETIRTKRVDGQVVESKTISRDTYKAQSRLIARSGHISMPDPKQPSVVEDGIREGNQP